MKYGNRAKNSPQRSSPETTSADPPAATVQPITEDLSKERMLLAELDPPVEDAAAAAEVFEGEADEAPDEVREAEEEALQRRERRRR